MVESFSHGVQRRRAPSTQGGYWLIKVVDKDDDRELDEEDRDYLLNKAFNDWVSSLWLQAGSNVDHTNLTPEVIQWAIDRASGD